MSMRPPASRRVRTPAIALALLVIVQSGPGGLWILSWRGKRARYARCRLTPCRRRVSHNTLDAADGAHRLHRHFRRTLDQDVKIGSRRPVTLRHRKEGTDRASSLRSDERSRSPESAFTFAEIGVHVQRNTHHFSNIRRFFEGSVFGVAGGSNSGMSLDKPRVRNPRPQAPSMPARRQVTRRAPTPILRTGPPGRRQLLEGRPNQRLRRLRCAPAPPTNHPATLRHGQPRSSGSGDASGS